MGRLLLAEIHQWKQFLSSEGPLMKTHSTMMIRLVTIAATIVLIGCDNSVAISPVYLGVVISPQPGSIPVGGTVVFTGTVSNNLSLRLHSNRGHPGLGHVEGHDHPPPGTSIPVDGDSLSFIMTAPSVTVSLAPLTASVALGGTPQFIGYAVGNLNNTLTWQT
jgi:hypothetical protein